MPEALNYVKPYYHLKVGDEEIKEMKNYINQIPEDVYRHNQLSYEDDARDVYVEKYRSCEIFAPPEATVFWRVGKKVFHYINSKHFEYDLSDKFDACASAPALPGLDAIKNSYYYIIYTKVKRLVANDY